MLTDACFFFVTVYRLRFRHFMADFDFPLILWAALRVEKHVESVDNYLKSFFVIDLC